MFFIFSRVGIKFMELNQDGMYKKTSGTKPTFNVNTFFQFFYFLTNQMINQAVTGITFFFLLNISVLYLFDLSSFIVFNDFVEQSVFIQEYSLSTMFLVVLIP